MLERHLIQATGFRNTGPVGARDGFEVRLRLPNYRGMRLSLLDGVDVTVDGERFGYETNVLAIRDEAYTLDKLREAVDARWNMFEWASVRVSKPGGLAPGVHKVKISARVRSPYFPPELQPLPVHAERLATIVLP